MNKALQALWKIDHTICMNSNEGNIKWNIDDKDDPTLYQNGEGYDPEDTDCKSFDDFCDCYDEIETALKEKEKLNKFVEIIVKKNVDVGIFIYSCTNIDYQFYLDHHKAIMNGMSNEELTQEEFNLLKEIIKEYNIC